jgi:hypothetical protein
VNSDSGCSFECYLAVKKWNFGFIFGSFQEVSQKVERIISV